MQKLLRVEKLLAALAAGSWVVSAAWIQACADAVAAVPMGPFELSETASPKLEAGAAQMLQIRCAAAQFWPPRDTAASCVCVRAAAATQSVSFFLSESKPSQMPRGVRMRR